MRSIVAASLRDDLMLQGYGLSPNAVLAGDVDTPPERPFLNLRWGVVDSALSMGPVGVRSLVVWVHDEPNDYTRIDQIVRRIRYLFEQLVGGHDETGWLTQIDWAGDSEDLSDDGHRTIVRTTSYTVIGSGY
jgi:hypothetical protein